MSEEIKELIEQLGYKEFYRYYEEKIKFIEDLQQKVEQLEKENKELKEENKRIFQNVNDDELLISNAMNYAELKKAEKRVEQLENIRKEVIEYIKDNACYSEGHCKCSFSQIALDNLLNILNKGENNE